MFMYTDSRHGLMVKHQYVDYTYAKYCLVTKISHFLAKTIDSRLLSRTQKIY